MRIVAVADAHRAALFGMTVPRNTSMASPGSAKVLAWEDRALDRSFSAARNRSSTRARRLVDAARLLAAESGSSSFTVAEVAARAGVSLRSFYRHFSGKDDLLLALFEEELQLGAKLLSEALGPARSPLERLRLYVVGLSGFVVTGSGYASLLVRETYASQSDVRTSCGWRWRRSSTYSTSSCRRRRQAVTSWRLIVMTPIRLATSTV